ncbi:AAA family ATPase [Acinetobacter junii]|uniref:SbcC/MukB-like Walker B domain-containing protein n=1 Tax=Acinetobacter junii TaxID=40215 RepID=UPI000F6664DA|nr:AAA family ATPase [Acinetobacter junii]MDH0667976.1 AAA family ATPase [Acinetobacter junii]MDH1691145.1 AAA family ATPase [Acinetobacter junii]MEB8380459.1 AAA family ATPase [Acinetobacter junii]RSE32210.1 ATP-dependent dsDNA exonuclease [Acinetobacter junii]USR72575.1 AAA family ATPase [Acinetobacter junii]
MKILSIRLKNLASLAGEHFIDFESEPLAHAGLIAIIGKTGAGKSTILDAMCLALFNQIPRLKGSDGKLIDVDGSELLTNSPLTVLRRGTGHGFAELCFVAQDQKHYLARWEIKRARENASGKLQSVQRSLKCLTDGVVVADKTKAVETHIQQITQLSFEQFTRAVLLAQSEVTAFLKARDNERGELLEYLTNSSIFAKIGQLAFEKTKEVRLQREKLESVLGHIEIRSDEEIAELQQRFQQLQQHVQQLENEKNQFRQQQQWFEQRDKINKDIALKKQDYDLQLKAQENIAKDRYLLSQLETFAEIRPIVFQQQQLQKTLQQLAPQIHQKHNEFSTLTTQFEQQKTLYAQAETTLNQFQDFERKHQTELTQVRKFVQERDYIAEEYKKTKIRLTQLESQQQPLIEQQQQLEQSIRNLSAQHTACLEQLKHSAQYAPLDKGLNAHIQQLKQFIQQYQKVEHTLGSIQQAQTQLEQDQNTFNNLVTQFGVTQQIEQRIEQQSKLKETQQIRINQLDAIQQKLQHYFELKNEVLTQQNKFEALQKQVQQLEQCSKKTEQDYHAAKTEREKLQLVLQQQRLLHAENIEHLRAELKHGEACLVCGSTEHPYRDNESQISKTLYALQQQQEQQAIQQEQQLFQLWQKAQQQFTQSHTEHNQLQQQLQQLHDKLKTHDQLLQQQVSQTNIQLDFSLTEHDITTKMQSLVLETSQTQQQLEKELLQLNQANKDQHVLNQNIQNILHQLQTIEHLQQQIQHIVDCLNADDKMAWSKHDVSISQHILQALQQRSQQLEHAESLIKQKEQINQQLNVLKTNLTGLTTQQTECAQQLKDIEIKGKQNTDAANQLIITMTGSAEIKANEWLQQHDQQRQQLQNQYQQVKQSFEQARQHFEQQKNVLEQLKVQQQQNHDALELCKTEITNWLAQHQNFAEDQLSELHAFSSTQEQQIRNAIQQADRALSEANSALKTMQEQLNVHLQSEPNIQVEQLTELINANQEILQQTTDQRDQLKLQLEVHQQNLAKQKKFADQIQQIQQQEHRWNKISSLIGDSKGKEFRDLAQQYNLDILLEYANQQLAMLSQRYTLKRLDNSLSLAIIDHDMDGETRSVASLSGGESFLTALAISLAIANMASGSMKIESLFIDEGFGTLDASSLHMVMNALDQLQSQGRKVILISHIQEMHERIPVQIQVQPMGSGSSRIEVVG